MKKIIILVQEDSMIYILGGAIKLWRHILLQARSISPNLTLWDLSDTQVIKNPAEYGVSLWSYRKGFKLNVLTCWLICSVISDPQDQDTFPTVPQNVQKRLFVCFEPAPRFR